MDAKNNGHEAILHRMPLQECGGYLMGLSHRGVIWQETDIELMIDADSFWYTENGLFVHPNTEFECPHCHNLLFFFNQFHWMGEHFDLYLWGQTNYITQPEPRKNLFKVKCNCGFHTDLSVFSHTG